MTGYRSAMHRKSRLMHKYPMKERTAMKRASIFERQRMKDSLDKPSPFSGILNVLDFLKRRKKESKNGTAVKGARKKDSRKQQAK